MSGPFVLLIEDDADIAFLSGSILRDAGFEVEVAPTVSLALAICERTVPSVAVIDVQLPYADGWEFVRAVRESGRWPKMRLAIHSVHSHDVKTTDSAFKWNVDAVLSKSGDLEDLVRCVQQLSA